MFQAVKLCLCVLFAITTLVSAQTICAYTTRGCIGSYGCCSNIPRDTCCQYPPDYGWSTLWTNMGTNWWGTAYGDKCVTSTGGTTSSNGQICLSVYDAPHYVNQKSANWRYYNATKRSTEDINEHAATNCVVPDTFGFKGVDGKSHELRIPKDKKFEDLDKLAQEGRFDELLKLAA